MKKSLGLALLVLSIVMTVIPAQGEVLQPAHVFTLRDLNSDGSVDAFDDVPPQIGVPSFSGKELTKRTAPIRVHRWGSFWELQTQSKGW